MSWWSDSDRIAIGLAGTNSYCLFERRNENFAITDFTGPRRADDRFQNPFQQFVLYCQFDFHFRQKINNILCPTIKLSMTFLASETFDLGHSYSLDAELGQGLPDVIEAEG